MVSTNQYYQRQWKYNWRGMIQYVMQKDPTGKYPVVSSRWHPRSQDYFRLLGDKRTVINAKTFDYQKELPIIETAGGFWLLDVHDMKGPTPRMHRFLNQYFEPVDSARFKLASATFFRFKPVVGRIQLVDSFHPFGRKELDLKLFGANAHLTLSKVLRLNTPEPISTHPFFFPSGQYRIRILAKGKRANGEAPHLTVWFGKQKILDTFVPEKNTWLKGTFQLKESDTCLIKIQFLNPFHWQRGLNQPFDFGNLIQIREGDWNGTLTRIGETDNYAAKWRNKVDGEQVSDTVTVRKFTPGSIVLYRKGLKGCYRGQLSPDGTFATGTADWYKSNGKWKATFPKMKFTGKLDRNLDILRIEIVSIPSRSEH